MKNIIYIPYWTNKYPLYITKSTDPEDEWNDNIVHLECKEAWLDQDYLLEDLWALLEVIPDLIKEQKEKRKKDVINLRITREEKDKIETLANMKWYKNISSYIREVALKE